MVTIIMVMVMTWVMVSITILTPGREASPAGRGSGAPAGSSAQRRRAGEEYWILGIQSLKVSIYLHFPYYRWEYRGQGIWENRDSDYEGRYGL